MKNVVIALCLFLCVQWNGSRCTFLVVILQVFPALFSFEAIRCLMVFLCEFVHFVICMRKIGTTVCSIVLFCDIFGGYCFCKHCAVVAEQKQPRDTTESAALTAWLLYILLQFAAAPNAAWARLLSPFFLFFSCCLWLKVRSWKIAAHFLSSLTVVKKKSCCLWSGDPLAAVELFSSFMWVKWHFIHVYLF